MRSDGDDDFRDPEDHDVVATRSSVVASANASSPRRSNRRRSTQSVQSQSPDVDLEEGKRLSLQSFAEEQGWTRGMAEDDVVVKDAEVAEEEDDDAIVISSKQTVPRQASDVSKKVHVRVPRYDAESTSLLLHTDTSSREFAAVAARRASAIAPKRSSTSGASRPLPLRTGSSGQPALHFGDADTVSSPTAKSSRSSPAFAQAKLPMSPQPQHGHIVESSDQASERLLRPARDTRTSTSAAVPMLSSPASAYDFPGGDSDSSGAGHRRRSTYSTAKSKRKRLNKLKAPEEEEDEFVDDEPGRAASHPTRATTNGTSSLAPSPAPVNLDDDGSDDDSAAQLRRTRHPLNSLRPSRKRASSSRSRAIVETDESARDLEDDWIGLTAAGEVSRSILLQGLLCDNAEQCVPLYSKVAGAEVPAKRQRGSRRPVDPHSVNGNCKLRVRCIVGLDQDGNGLKRAAATSSTAGGDDSSSGGDGGVSSPMVLDDDDDEVVVGAMSPAEALDFEPNCRIRRVLCSPLLSAHDPTVALRAENVPVGLVNQGATCYLSVVLQSLFHLAPPIRHFLMSRPTPVTENCSGRDRAITALRDLFITMQYTERASLQTATLCNVMKVQPCVQQDAQEFMGHMLTMIDQASAAAAGDGQADSHVGSGLVERLCGFSEETRVMCTECGYVSSRTTNEKMLGINMEPSFAESMKKAGAEEKLTGSDQYHCPVCKEKKDATTVRRMQSLPPLLVCHAKRFVYDVTTLEKTKLRTPLRVPMRFRATDILPLSSLQVDDEDNCYELVGVVRHHGHDAASGHYTADLRRDGSAAWWRMDDHKVTKIQTADYDGDTLSDCDSYLFFFANARLRSWSAELGPLTGEASADTSGTIAARTVTENAMLNDALECALLLEHAHALCEAFHAEAKELALQEAWRAKLTSGGARVWIPTSWLAGWLRAKTSYQVPAVEASSLMCEHGDLDPVRLVRDAKHIPPSMLPIMRRAIIATKEGLHESVKLHRSAAARFRDTYRSQIEAVGLSADEPVANGDEERPRSVVEVKADDEDDDANDANENDGSAAADKVKVLADSEVERVRGILAIANGLCGAHVPATLDPLLCDIPSASQESSLCAVCVDQLLLTLQQAATSRQRCREAIVVYRDMLAKCRVQSIKPQPGDDVYLVPYVFMQEVERVCAGNLSQLKRKTGYATAMQMHPALPVDHDVAPLLAFVRLAHVFLAHYKVDTVTDFLLCEHGALPTRHVKSTAVTPILWQEFVASFGASMMGAEVKPGKVLSCTVCAEESGKEKELAQEVEDLRAAYRAECPGWESASYFSANASCDEPGTYYLLPVRWYQAWRRFAMAKTKVVVVDGEATGVQPSLPPLSGKDCLCEHGGLATSLRGALRPGAKGLDQLPDTGFLAIEREHRDAIVERHGEDDAFPLPRVEVQPGGMTTESPPVCAACAVSAASTPAAPDGSFTNAHFWIVYPKKSSMHIEINKDNVVVDRRVLAAIETLSVDEAAAWRRAVCPDDEGERRTSSRSARAADFGTVMVKGFSSVAELGELCSAIHQQTELLPVFMKLYVRDRSYTYAEYDSFPLETIGFPPNSAIFVMAPDPDDDVVAGGGTRSSRRRGRSQEDDDGFERYDSAAFEDVVPPRRRARTGVRNTEERAFEESVFAGQ